MKKTYRLTGIDCAVCASKVEAELKKLSIIKDVSYNFTSQKLYLEFEDEIDLKELFKQISIVVKSKEPDAVLSDASSEKSHKEDLKKSIFSLGNIIRLAGVPILIIALVLEFGHIVSNNYILLGIYLTAYFMISFSVIYKFFKNMIHLRLFDENFLMTAATVGAFVLGEYFEGVTIMLFYQIGEFLQELAVRKSRNNIQSLMNSKESFITKIDGSNQQTVITPDKVNIGDKILIKAGERVAVDGIVHEGISTLDTSSLTGESLPRNIAPGDEILSGSINLQNSITASVTKYYHESTASRIMEMIEQASSKKSKSEQFITKFSKIYTPLVVGIALIIGLIIPLIAQMNMQTWSIWAKTAITFLIVSCPCALVLSIPMSFFCGIGAASKMGVLFKGANYLETLANVDTFIFDKTGTITNGVFEVIEILPEKEFSTAELLKTAAYAESFSTHPLAKAVIRKYAEGIDSSLITEHKSFVGLGVFAIIDEQNVLAGNSALLKNHGIKFDEVNTSGSKIYCAVNGKFAGTLVLADTLKNNAILSIAQLKKQNIHTVMLTGDNEEVASNIAKTAEIDEHLAQCLPIDKLNVLQKFKEQGKVTAFVGEGINDVLAITGADVGVSMGVLGSDVSMESADMVLMTDELQKLPMMVRLARHTKKIVLLNILLVLIVKFVVMIINFFPSLQSLVLAELADVGIALVAVLIATSIFKFGRKTQSA